MPRAFSETVYTRIFAGEHVKLSGLTKGEYETIRTALYTNHRMMKELGGTELSILASYSESGEAFFRLGIRTRKSKTFTIEVLPP